MEDDAADDETFPVEVELTDTLDLHTFSPRDVPIVVREFLDFAWERGFPGVRIIHGKGIGVQREIVRAILRDDVRVRRFGDPPDGAGWGATEVDFAPR